jgi:hypothetical protein
MQRETFGNVQTRILAVHSLQPTFRHDLVEEPNMEPIISLVSSRDAEEETTQPAFDLCDIPGWFPQL